VTIGRSLEGVHSMPTAKEFTLTMDDRPGTLSKFCRALADRNVGIVAARSFPSPSTIGNFKTAGSTILNTRKNLSQEKALEGKYLIQSEERNLSAVQAVEIYKDLSEVERAFSELKDVLEMRAVYHQTETRVEAHIFIAFLAFLLDRALEKKLKSAGMDFSSKETWQMLKTVRVVEIDLGGGERKQSVTQGSSRAARILKTLGIEDLDPAPKKARERVASDTSKTSTLVFNGLSPLRANMG